MEWQEAGFLATLFAIAVYVFWPKKRRRKRRRER